MIRCDSGADSNSLDVKKAGARTGRCKARFFCAATPRAMSANVAARRTAPQDGVLRGFFMSVIKKNHAMNEVAQLAPRPDAGRKKRRPLLYRAAPALSAVAFLALWHLVSLGYPAFILPGPLAVAAKFVERMADGTLIVHALTTLSEALPGLIAGTVLAFAVGYPVAKWHLADRLISPFMVASQGIPVIAIAPLLFIWFGSGFAAKLLVCTLIVFFPITINVIAGLRSLSPRLIDLFRMLNASRWHMFTKLELPAALPYVFAGLRTGGTLAMIGALTGEFISANRGLGFLMNQASGLYDTALVMAAIVATVLSALSIYASVRMLERLAQRVR